MNNQIEWIICWNVCESCFQALNYLPKVQCGRKIQLYHRMWWRWCVCRAIHADRCYWSEENENRNKWSRLNTEWVRERGSTALHSPIIFTIQKSKLWFAKTRSWKWISARKTHCIRLQLFAQLFDANCGQRVHVHTDTKTTKDLQENDSEKCWLPCEFSLSIASTKSISFSVSFSTKPV